MNVSRSVSVSQAHAIDEWPVGDHYVTGRAVTQPKSLDSRVEEAVHFMDHFCLDWPLLVDDPERGDLFLNTYAAWPTRFFIVKDSKLVYLAQPCEEHSFSMPSLETALVDAVRL